MIVDQIGACSAIFAELNRYFLRSAQRMEYRRLHHPKARQVNRPLGTDFHVIFFLEFLE